MRVAEAKGGGGSWVIEFAPEHHIGGIEVAEEEDGDDLFSQLMEELEHGTKKNADDTQRGKSKRKRRRRAPPVLSASRLNRLVRPDTVEEWLASWWTGKTVLRRWREEAHPTRFYGSV